MLWADLGFKNAHFILIDDTKVTNDYETTLIAAHELGHALFQEELRTAVGKPIFKRMWESFKNRNLIPILLTIEAHSVSRSGIPTSAGRHLAKDRNPKPANLEETTSRGS